MKKLFMLLALCAVFVACKEETPETGESTGQTDNGSNANNGNNNNNDIDTSAPISKILGVYEFCRIAEYDEKMNFVQFRDPFIGELKLDANNNKQVNVVDEKGNTLWTLSNIRFITKNEIAIDVPQQSRDGMSFVGEQAEPVTGTSSYAQGIYSLEHKEAGIRIKVSGGYQGYYRLGLENKRPD